MAKVCCGFGHRNIFQNIENELDESIRNAIEIGCTAFYTGAMGDFDAEFSKAVRKAKKHYKDISIKLICVKPYLTEELNKNKDYYYSMYDDVIIPNELAGVHYKQAIIKRNRWIVDNSDVVIAYIIRDYGGAFDSVNYADKCNKTIFRI